MRLVRLWLVWRQWLWLVPAPAASEAAASAAAAAAAAAAFCLLLMDIASSGCDWDFEEPNWKGSNPRSQAQLRILDRDSKNLGREVPKKSKADWT